VASPRQLQTGPPHSKETEVIAGRVRFLIVAGALVVLLLDAFLLISGGPAERRDRQERLEALDAKRVRTSAELRGLQEGYDQSVIAVTGWFDILDEVLNLGRTSQGMEQARSRFETATAGKPQAETAAAQLAVLSERILGEAKVGREDLAGLLEVVSDVEDEQFLRSLDRAYELLIRTHEIYSQLNQTMHEGYTAYSELYTINEKFFTERFRTTREAANVYDFRTENLIPRITQFKGSYNERRNEALLAAQRAAEAFQRSRELNEAR